MTADNHLAYPFAYHRGKRISFIRSDQSGGSYFGGPGDDVIETCQDGPYHIHHIASISNRDVGVLGYEFGFSIPFYYPMRVDGCELSYRRTATKAIQITSLAPPEPPGVEWPFPYEGYPPLLPYIPLKVHEVEDVSLEDFSEDVMQGIEDLEKDELVFVVPPNPTMGVSLWGPWLDAEDLQIIFRYHSSTGTMRVYSACT